MTDYASAVTLVGKNRAITMLFGGSGNAMTYMAVGTGTSDPTEASTTLSAEKTGDSYVRVETTRTYPSSEGGVNKVVKSEGTFDTDNITATTTISEIAIYDAISGGNAFCICRIPDTIKDGSKIVKFTITNSVA